MISEADISQALGQRLAAMSGVPDIAWENHDHVPLRPFLDVQIVRVSTSDDTLDISGTLHTGFMQITIVENVDRWATSAERLADSISAQFPKGLHLPVTNGEITIKRPAFVGQGFRDGPDWRLPVRIDYEAA